MSRFAILRHTEHPTSKDHYDIVIEKIPGLKMDSEKIVKFETTSVLTKPNIKIKYMGLIGKKYLQYEGIVDGNRGSVEKVDLGDCEFVGNNSVKFSGKILNGIYSFKGAGGEFINILESSVLCKE
ncbi:hypothetical protein HN747_01810 [archaeon]|jgi:hypothetical protein|nr:hypothetical protein [archaeon]